VVLALAVAASMLVLPAASTAAGEEGKAVFDQLCQGCHTIGGGKSVGPDLEGLADRRDRAWTKAFILTPDKVIASGDPIAKELLAEYGAPMPNLGVTEAQVEPLLALLGFAAGTTTTTPTDTTPTATTPEPTPGSGDVRRGENLFTGAERFGAGGPSCLSCHSIAGVGALGGGQLGPDLTDSFAKFGGQQGLQAALKTVPFPTMIPIFSRKALTANERDDLVAFLEKAPDQQRPASTAGKLVGFSVAAACLLVILAMGLWRHRLNGVRKPLVNRSTRK
jgi:mono/diheme cytochrome c family protein